MKARVSVTLFPILLATTLAGCAFPSAGDPCQGREPLLIHTYKDVTDASRVRIDVSLWNCKDETLVLQQECFPFYPLYPRVDWNGTTYLLAYNATATPLDERWCYPPVESGPFRVEAGASPGVTGLAWDGSFTLSDGGPSVRVPGNHTLRVEAAGYLAERVVEVPP